MYYDEGTGYSTLSKKQLGVIFRHYKLGNLKPMREEMISKMYYLVDSDWSIYSRNDLEKFEISINNVIKYLFAEEYDKANYAFNAEMYQYFYGLQDEFYELYLNHEDEDEENGDEDEE